MAPPEVEDLRVLIELFEYIRRLKGLVFCLFDPPGDQARMGGKRGIDRPNPKVGFFTHYIAHSDHYLPSSVTNEELACLWVDYLVPEDINLSLARAPNLCLGMRLC